MLRGGATARRNAARSQPLDYDEPEGTPWGLRCYLCIAIVITASVSIMALMTLALGSHSDPAFNRELALRGQQDVVLNATALFANSDAGANSASAPGDTVATEDETAGSRVTNTAPVPASDDDMAPAFAHDDDPIPVLHDERNRPMSGRGCTFSLCNKNTGKWRVAGREASTLPLMYMVVPHRNRIDNLVRLLSSLTNATTPEQRACLCVIVSDFNTSTSVTAPWKNLHCIASYRREHNIWMDDEAFYAGRSLSRGQLRAVATTYASAPDCPEVPAPLPERLRDRRFGGRAQVTDTFPPAHVDVYGLTGRQAVRHALAFYEGESVITDGNAYVNNPKIKFSRAGGIMAGVDAIQTPPNSSLVFICDADMILRPGFVEDMAATPVRGSSVFLPIVWSSCWGTTLEDAPRTRKWRSSAAGFWRPGGRGMVVAYLSDLKSVGGMR